MKCLTDEHNTIMVTWANLHYQDFVMNWVDHVQSVGVKSYLVCAPLPPEELRVRDSILPVECHTPPLREAQGFSVHIPSSHSLRPALAG